MKKMYFLLALLFVLFSCSEDDEECQKNDQEKWILTQMSGNMGNSETTGSNMQWQEFYLLNADGTFKKTRGINGVITEVTGTYRFIDSTDQKFIEFLHQSQNELIGNCFTGSLKEEMHFQSNNIFLSNWEYCDGPGLKYEKVK